MFFPNLVAFTSESETCKMKRCVQGDIEIHDVKKYENLNDRYIFLFISIPYFYAYPIW